MRRKRLVAATGRFAHLIIAAITIVFGATTAYALSEFDATSTWNVAPVSRIFPTDRACPAGTTLFGDRFQSVTHGVEVGTFTDSIVIDGVTVTVEITTQADNSFDFSISNGVTRQMFVKGSNYLLYQYDPPVSGATNTGSVSYDTGLHDGVNANKQDEYQDVSHLDFCLAPVYPLRAAKTADGSFNRVVEWTLTKSVDTASHTGNAGETAGSSTWQVVADKSESFVNYRVTGDITIFNDNVFAVPFTVSDVLDDATAATVDCSGATEVPAEGSVTCNYSASPADASATLNTATITSGNPAVEGATATAPVAFSEILIGYDSGTLADSRFSYSETISGDTTVTFPETFSCPADASLYTNGTYSFQETNTATLNDNISLQDSATVDVTCSLAALVPTKNATASYDRTVSWTLDKTVSPGSHSGYAGDSFDSTWTVTVDKTEVLDNYQVTGNISIYNPAAITQTFGVSDALNDGTTASVSCDSNTVAAGDTVACTYAASPDDDSATQNTATVSAAGNPDQTATAPVSFTENLIGYDSGTLEDLRSGYSETVSGDTIETFDETFECSTDWADYGADGSYSFTETNTATLNGNINLSDSASVTVDCEAGTIDVQKYTGGGVEGAYDWQFALFIGPDGFGGTQVGNTSSTLGDIDGILDFGDPVPALPTDTPYTVCELIVAAGWSSEWSIGGVTVIPYNPNADDDPPEDLGNRCFDVGAGTSYTVTVGQNLRLTVDNTFPGGEPRTPGYWKNWSSCSGGGQYAKTEDDVDPLNEFVSLDEVLTNPGITWNGFYIDSCELAVSILDQRDSDTGKKMASDAAYTLAMHLLAAQLNFGAGAETCTAATDAALDAQTLLVNVGFDATGKYLRPKDAEYQVALDLAYTLDQYNNGLLCSQ